MKQVTVRKYCEVKDCGGEMIKTGTGFANSVASYSDHRCYRCKAFKAIEGRAYPYTFIEFEPEEKEERWIT